MKKFTKITLIISLVCIVVGLGITIGTGLFSDLFHGRVSMKVGPDGIDIREISQFVDDGGEYPDTRIAGNEIEELKISVKAATLNMIKDDQRDGITIVGGSEALEIVHSVDKDILYLDIHQKTGIHTNWELEDVNLTLIIPDTLKFDEVEIDLNASAMSAEGLAADEISVNSNASAVMLERMETGILDVDNNAGTLTVNGAIVRELDVDCNAGSATFDLQGAYEEFDYEIEAKVGTVRIGERQYEGLTSSVKLMNEGAERKMDLSCKAGEINVDFSE